MADIDGLKRRIELIDLRLKTAHSTRERESTALAEMWEQIRGRFESQKAEIVSLREQIRALEDTRDDLQNMVDRLLGAVEGGLERMSDETISNIRAMASGLLDEAELPARLIDGSFGVGEASGAARYDIAEYPYPEEYDDQPVENEEAAHSDPKEPDESEDDDFLAALEHSANAAPNATYAAMTESEDVLTLETPVDGPLSPGIRDLIARVEESVGEKLADDMPPPTVDVPRPAEAPDELNQDLLEIEQLRNELLGLRHKISGSGR